MGAGDSMKEKYVSDPAVLSDILGLVGVHLSPSRCAELTAGQQEEAEKWAAKSYLKASDNNVRVPKKPEWLCKL
jgi:hypothetical protein